MMKLAVSLALACVLSSKVYGLRCLQCIHSITEPCIPTQATCAANVTRCISATLLYSVGGASQGSTVVRTCATPDSCVSGSLNLGAIRYTVNSECCDTDFCNIQRPPAFIDDTPNGRECVGCAGGFCTDTVPCLGPEDHCISLTVFIGNQTVPLKGCASETVCVGDLNIELGSVNLTCCKGNLCNNGLPVTTTQPITVTSQVNNALPVAQNFLLLLVSLASFILLY